MLGWKIRCEAFLSNNKPPLAVSKPHVESTATESNAPPKLTMVSCLQCFRPVVSVPQPEDPFARLCTHLFQAV